MDKTYVEQLIDDDLCDTYNYTKNVKNGITEAYHYIKKHPDKKDYICKMRDGILAMLPGDSEVMLFQKVYAELIIYLHLTGKGE